MALGPKSNVSLAVFLLLMVGSISVSYAEEYPLTPLSDLGVEVKVSKSGADTIREFYDTKTKTTLLYDYNSSNVLISIEARNAFGKTIEKTRFLPNRLWKQTATELHEWFKDSRGRNIHRITSLTGARKTVEFPYKPNLNQVCPAQSDTKNAEDILKVVEPRTKDHLGNAKVTTNDCDAYPGGNKRLLKDMQKAINIGVTCLAGTSPESKVEATKLLAYFDNPKSDISIFCAKTDATIQVSPTKSDSVDKGTLARALIPPEQGGPGILINVSNSQKASAAEREATLFHEMLHWLGILHNESFDTPYIAENCCLSEDKNSPRTKKACALLSKSPRPSIDSKEYMNDFTDLMLLNYRSMIPMDLIQSTTLKKMANKPLDLSSEFEADQKIRKYGNVTSDVHAEVLKDLDPKLKEPVTYIKDGSNYGQAVDLTASLVALMYQKSSYEDFAQSADQVKAKYKELIAGAKDDAEKQKIKESIHTWISEYSLISFDVADPVESGKDFSYKVWENLEKDL